MSPRNRYKPYKEAPKPHALCLASRVKSRMQPIFDHYFDQEGRPATTEQVWWAAWGNGFSTGMVEVLREHVREGNNFDPRLNGEYFVFFCKHPSLHPNKILAEATGEIVVCKVVPGHVPGPGHLLDMPQNWQGIGALARFLGFAPPAPDFGAPQGNPGMAQPFMGAGPDYTGAGYPQRANVYAANAFGAAGPGAAIMPGSTGYEGQHGGAGPTVTTPPMWIPPELLCAVGDDHMEGMNQETFDMVANGEGAVDHMEGVERAEIFGAEAAAQTPELDELDVLVDDLRPGGRCNPIALDDDEEEGAEGPVLETRAREVRPERIDPAAMDLAKMGMKAAAIPRDTVIDPIAAGFVTSDEEVSDADFEPLDLNMEFGEEGAIAHAAKILGL